MGTDSLYYIMDYSGKYYRTDKADQLVVAKSEEEATVFTFAQANSRICVGKKAAFYCMVPLAENKTEIEPVGIEQNIVEIEKIVKEQEETTEHMSSIRELTYDELQKPVEKNVSSYDLSQMDWVEYLTHFTYVVSVINEYRDELSKKHSDIDQKLCDILHYIELCETDNEEAVELIELLRVCRENRRDIKDELMRIDYFQNNFGTSANVAKAKQALKCMKGLETRKYKPRKYDELFENCIMKGKRLEKADLYAADADMDSSKRQYSIERTYKDEGGEHTMAGERFYTPFDGKKNDWLLFARQQAEFYRNASQYITNLQVTINEIDQEIEDILKETEGANCNVTQGYKVFKRLKELRLERKAKTQELGCMYALTDYIDCDALADACEENLAEVEDIMGVRENNDITKIQPVGNEHEEIHKVENIQDMVG